MLCGYACGMPLDMAAALYYFLQKGTIMPNKPLKELKAQYYGRFEKWLELNGFKNLFSWDTWETKIFEKMYEQFQREDKLAGDFKRTIDNLRFEQIEHIYNDKKRQHESKQRGTEKRSG